MKTVTYCLRAWLFAAMLGAFVPAGHSSVQQIPLPEHPRPDFKRVRWENLNGPWLFRFDPDNVGIKNGWPSGAVEFPGTIQVPFPWGSGLSGIENEANIGWYARTLTIPENWRGERVFIVIGASDWYTTVWLDGQELGSYQGGYTPFEFDLTPFVKWCREQRLIVRVDDTPHSFKLEGKQGYGPARGIWQTVYLEARPAVALKTVHFTPDIDRKQVAVAARLDKTAPESMTLELRFKDGDLPNPVVTKTVKKGQTEVAFAVSIPGVHLWSLDDPYLYEVSVALSGESTGTDKVSTYFGMRKISVMNLPGTDYPYIALNNKPVYLKLALDQSYHPDGFYTFPSDEFMRDEILRSRRIGLNGQRIHIKVEIPRKLYWADRLGLLIMADVPNSWGQPDELMRKETEVALRGMIERDYNHPCIFSWINFNETWGLFSGDKKYVPETQEWVASMYRITKELDPTRLVEDNSPCNFDHVITDINSWHAYLPGYKWNEHLDQVTKDTFPGSTWNFIGGRKQANQPLLNSECGNVWGYKGSTGDVDWSWDYHIMMNAFRRHPEVCGWLYTEHHDVINEWNGYYRYDRSGKETGLGELTPGMSLHDLHSEIFVAVGNELCRQTKPGTRETVPLYASFMTDRNIGREVYLRFLVHGWDDHGRKRQYAAFSRTISVQPWMCTELEPVELNMPDRESLVVLGLCVEDAAGTVLHRNFTTFLVTGNFEMTGETVTETGQRVTVIRFAPDSFTDADWSLKQWDVFDGLKVNGAGAGYFEYEIPWPAGVSTRQISAVTFSAEVSAKQLLGKDRENAGKQEGNFMLGKGTHDPGQNPNAYPMTDELKHPSAVRVRINGRAVAQFDLPDDPADHRGVLSWFSQKRDGTLNEAGSYGYLISVNVPKDALSEAGRTGKVIIRLEVEDFLPGGLAIYGKRFGRYPLDPTLTFIME